MNVWVLFAVKSVGSMCICKYIYYISHIVGLSIELDFFCAEMDEINSYVKQNYAFIVQNFTQT